MASLNKTLLAQFSGLSLSQRKKLLDALQTAQSGESAVALIENSRPAKSNCPHCQTAGARPYGSASGLQRYRCVSCKRTFNALTGTPLARLRHKGKWLEYSQDLKDGLSVRKSADRIGVHFNTTFRWRHRFLALPKAVKARKLEGIAEADETYFLESLKGCRRMPRKGRKRGGRAKKRGLSDEQVCVLVARDRMDRTTDHILPQFNQAALQEVLGPVLAEDTVLVSDGSPVYRAFTAQAGIEHQALNLAAGVRVIGKAFHVQNVNAYHSRLKGWMAPFNGVSTRHLDSYLGWKRLLERHGNAPEPAIFLSAALAQPKFNN